MKPGFTRKFALIFIFLVAADQLSKYLVRHLGGFYICNKGVAFGLRISSITLWLAIVFLLVMIISNSKLLFSSPKPSRKLQIANYIPTITNFGLALILSGAASNLIDRFYFGCVIDFIDLKFWPVFNLADSFIICGVFLFLAKHSKT